MAGEVLGTAMSETQSHGTHGELKAIHDRVMDVADDIREMRDDQEKVENEDSN